MPTDDPSAGTPGPATPRRWPLRPGLTILLLALSLLSVILTVGVVRQFATIPHAIAQRLNLPDRAPLRVPEPRSVLVVLDADTPRAAVASESPTDGLAEPFDKLRAAAVAANAPAALWTIKPTTITPSGFYSPTQRTLLMHWTSQPIDGCKPLPQTQMDPLQDAAADALESVRAIYRPWAQMLRDSARIDGGDEKFIRGSSRGYAVNALSAALLLAFFLSLAPAPTALTRLWDKALAYYDTIGPAAVLALVWGSAPAVLGIVLLLNIGPVSDLLHAHPLVGWFAYVLVFMIAAGVGFLPTYGQSILGGWVFGLAIGFPGAMLGFVGGAVIGYFIAQRVSKHKVEDLIQNNPKAAAVREALIGHGFWRTLGIITLIRVPPNSPFALTNLVMATAGVKFLPYLFGTAIGMAPRTFVAVAAAAAGKATGARDIQDFIEEQPWWVLPAGLAAMFIALAIIGLIANRALHQVTKNSNSGSNSNSTRPTDTDPAI